MNILRGMSPSARGINLAILAFNTLLVAGLWLAVLDIVGKDRRETIQAAIDKNDTLAIAFEEYTEHILENADQFLKLLVRHHAHSRGKVDLDQYVADHTLDNMAYADVALADNKGNVSATAFHWRSGGTINLADREHFRVHAEADTGAMFIGKPVTDRISGRSVVPLTRRINRPDGSFGGIAMVLIEHPRFTNVLQDAKLRQLDIMSLVGLDGVTRARLRGNIPTTGEDISKSPLFAEQARRPVGNYTARGQVDGIQRLFSYRTLPGYRLIVTVGAAEADVLASHLLRRQQYFWGAGIASVLIAGFSVLLIGALASQRRAATLLARSQARVLATFNQAAVGIAHSDLDGRCLEVNQKLCDITGYAREELLGRPFTDITHPDDITATIEFHQRVKANHERIRSLQREKRYLRKDGAIVWCLLTTSVVRDEAGDIDYLATIIQDITDRKAAEQTLQALEQEQRRLAELAETERARLADAQAVAKIGSWETRFPELRVFWSAETHRIFGTDAASFEPTHEKFLAFVHPDDREAVNAAFITSIGAQTPRMIQHRIVLADGGVKIVEERWRTFLDDQGQPLRAVGTCRDITDQKKTERERAQLAAIVESSNDAIISRTVDRIILSWNPAAERMFGWTAAEAIGQTVSLITPPEYDRKLVSQVERVLRGETVPPVETWRMRKDGTHFEVQLSISAVRDDSGNITAIATIYRDITDRRRAEAALRTLTRRLSEVEENERRNIHRELHDQIGASLSALKLDLSLIGGMLDAETQKTVGTRLQRAQRLAGETIARIRDVMDDLRPPALDDFGLLAALRTHAQPLAARLGIPIHVNGNDIEPRPAISIETALFRIAQEALTNIAKHAGAHEVVMTLNSDTDRVTLVIADDGSGFDAGQGTLRPESWGLRNMRERAQGIGATLRIESAPGSGTRVIVELSRDGT
jgi:PAS domain S-box-containing protein